MTNILCLASLALVAVCNARPRNTRQTGSVSLPCRRRQQYTSPDGAITFPNNSIPYPGNTSCNWIIAPPGNRKLSLTFTSFDINSGLPQCEGKRCRCDFVQVKELDPPPGKTGFNLKYCNNNPPPSSILVTSRVRIQFVSDSSQEGAGFAMRYSAVQPITGAPLVSGLPSTQSAGALKQSSPNGTAQTGNQTAHQGAADPTNSTPSQGINTTGNILLGAATGKVPTKLPNRTDAVISVNSQTPATQGVRNATTVIIPPVTLPGGDISTGVPPRTVPGSPSFPGGVGPVSTWSGPSHAVMFVEVREDEEKVPDIIVLGPSIPVVLIFVLVVAGIAWWNYKFTSEEMSRYESYASHGSSAAYWKKHKKRMEAIQKGKLYSDMTKNWKGESFNQSSPMIAGPQRRKKASFAGRLLELAETVRTPRPSRPSSVVAEESVPLRPAMNAPSGPSSSLLPPGGAESGGGSRPTSMALRDALIMIFGGIDSGESEGSGFSTQSKRASKRVSFIDEDGQPPVRHEPSPPEQLEPEVQDEPSLPDKENEEPERTPSRPLQIPAILVRQPSEEKDDRNQSPACKRRKQATPDSPTEDTSDVPKHDSVTLDSLAGAEDEAFSEEVPDLEAAVPGKVAPCDSQEPGPSDIPDDAKEEEDPADTTLLFPDLEDFLLNLDKDTPLDDPPYSCSGHIQDILRKSYGDEEPSSLGPEAVLSVPEEFLGMIRSGPRTSSESEAEKEVEQLDDVD